MAALLPRLRLRRSWRQDRHANADPDRGAGSFTLERGHERATPVRSKRAADDIALVLHTSGTTSRPKIVPLSQRNLCASAWNIAQTLRLSPDDRCLSIMPLFHIHGLIATVLASLASGGTVFCTPGFHALRFFAWMTEAKPTWYSAVPTMHQAILARASHNEAGIRANPLRFIRSSSASLPRQVLGELEAVFSAPVIESYGMTEASHQMASNLLPPGIRKPGKVGVAAGPEIAIMDEAGNVLPANVTGEVVIRGDNVTTGYENNPKANAEAFAHGWFHTGDQGMLDDDGYLTLTGRLKEIINRGGEKISPAEVDDILMDHPAVQQALTFAMPHDKLGEDVAAAVVLARRRYRQRTGNAGLRRIAPCRFQGATEGGFPPRNSKRGHRQAAAHRAGSEAWVDRRERLDRYRLGNPTAL